MPKPKNEPIGECPCPFAGCGKTAHVFKFRARGNEKQSRLAGKLYMHCKECGRLGADGAPAMQNYILENSKIWDAKEKAARAETPEKPVPAPAPAPAPAPKPAPAPQPSAPAKRPDLWDM